MPHSTAAHPQSPPPPTRPGVAAAAPAEQAASGPVIIYGAFSVDAAGRQRLAEHPHRSLVLTSRLLPTGSHHAGLPFAAAALFADDIAISGGLAVGWFSIDAAAVHGMPFRGLFAFTLSLGDLVAAPVAVRVR